MKIRAEMALHELEERYRRAAHFFRTKIATVDDVIKTAAEKGLSDKQVLQLLEKKYPFLKTGLKTG